MRNLQLIKKDVLIHEVFKEPGKLCQALEALFYITSQGIYVIKGTEVSLCTELPISSEVVYAEFLYDENQLSIFLQSGEIYAYDINLQDLETMGCVPQGLLGGEWSPDQDILVLLTADNTMILMTKDYDAILETTLHPQEFGENKLITVGWGSKETQFHGSEGKEAAKAKPSKVEPAGEWDDKKPRIRWRGDGQMFVTSTVDPKHGARCLRVWNHSGLLLSTSEDKNGLEHSLDWRPSGNLIVTSQHLSNKHEVIFFEKNGLQHGSFTLPFPVKTFKIIDVKWNITSNVLCIWGQDLAINCYKVLLFTTQNYHYYLKQSFRFGVDQMPLEVRWDSQDAFHLHLITADGQYHNFHWCLGSQSTAETTMAVVDGCRLLLTPFDQLVVPPPMCAYSIIHPNPVNQVALDTDGTSLLTIMDDGQMAFFSYKENSQAGDNLPSVKVEFPASGRNHIRLPHCTHLFKLDNRQEEFCQWTWLTEDLLIAVDQNEFSLHLFDLKKQEFKFLHAFDQPILSLYAITGKAAFIQLWDGSVVHLNSESLKLEPFFKFTQPCPRMAAMVSKYTQEEILVGSTSKGVLLGGKKGQCTELAKFCTSFKLIPDFLVYVALQCKLYCAPINPTGFGAPLETDFRRLEEGSELLCIVPKECKAVLQLPRGNIETIYPRPLMIKAVTTHLDNLEFGKAFVLMRVHRINMGLLYSHHPKIFLDHVNRFVEQIADPSMLNIFLTSLRNITDADKICKSVRLELEKIDPKKYLLSILTSFAIENKLEEALLKIASLEGEEQESALRYLVYLVDANTLYNVALGLYDFDLVTLVARHSQKDPKEYVPFLTELQTLEPNYRKFKIDTHLEKYSKALQHLAQCGKELLEECLEYVRQHSLYKDSLTLFPSNSDEWKAMWRLYGDHLIEQRKYGEAGLAFWRGGDLEKAVRAYQQDLDWGMCLALVEELGYSPEEKETLLLSLVDGLSNNGQLVEAAHLMEHYLKDIKEALQILIEGHEWEQAFRLTSLHCNICPKSTLVGPLLHHQELTISSCTRMGLELTRMSDRLATVRKQKEEEALARSAAGMGDDLDTFSELDAESQISAAQHSIFTSSSTSSRRSSKSRRKMEKKKYSLKEGSEHEDTALVIALSEIIERTNKIREESRVLVKVLQLMDLDKEAKEVVEALKSLSFSISQEIPKIWTSPPASEGVPTMKYGPQSTVKDILAHHIIPKKEISDPRLETPPNFKKDISWIPAQFL